MAEMKQQKYQQNTLAGLRTWNHRIPRGTSRCSLQLNGAISAVLEGPIRHISQGGVDGATGLFLVNLAVLLPLVTLNLPMNLLFSVATATPLLGIIFSLKTNAALGTSPSIVTSSMWIALAFYLGSLVLPLIKKALYSVLLSREYKQLLQDWKEPEPKELDLLSKLLFLVLVPLLFAWLYLPLSNALSFAISNAGSPSLWEQCLTISSCVGCTAGVVIQLARTFEELQNVRRWDNDKEALKATMRDFEESQVEPETDAFLDLPEQVQELMRERRSEVTPSKKRPFLRATTGIYKALDYPAFDALSLIYASTFLLSLLGVTSFVGWIWWNLQLLLVASGQRWALNLTRKSDEEKYAGQKRYEDHKSRHDP